MTVLLHVLVKEAAIAKSRIQNPKRGCCHHTEEREAVKMAFYAHLSVVWGQQRIEDELRSCFHSLLLH